MQLLCFTSINPIEIANAKQKLQYLLFYCILYNFLIIPGRDSGVANFLECEKGRMTNEKFFLAETVYPANNAMQDPYGPCEGCPYRTRIDLVTGAVVPHMG